MNPQEIAALLAVAQAFDHRNVGEGDIGAWLDALGDLPFGECRQAVVEHYRRSTDWLMPAHLRRLVIDARNEAAMRDPERFALPPDDEERGGEPMVIGGALPAALRGSALLREAIVRAKQDRAELVAAERRAQREAGEAWAMSDRHRRAVGGGRR